MHCASSALMTSTSSTASAHFYFMQDEVVLVRVVDNALRQQLTTGAGRTVPNTNGLKCEADPETLEYSQKFLAKIKEEILAKEGVSSLG